MNLGASPPAAGSLSFGAPQGQQNGFAQQNPFGQQQAMGMGMGGMNPAMNPYGGMGSGFNSYGGMDSGYSPFIPRGGLGGFSPYMGGGFSQQTPI